jgi:hypothetical protein
MVDRPINSSLKPSMTKRKLKIILALGVFALYAGSLILIAIYRG